MRKGLSTGNIHDLMTSAAILNMRALRVGSRRLTRPAHLRVRSCDLSHHARIFPRMSCRSRNSAEEYARLERKCRLMCITLEGWSVDFCGCLIHDSPAYIAQRRLLIAGDVIHVSLSEQMPHECEWSARDRHGRSSKLPRYKSPGERVDLA